MKYRIQGNKVSVIGNDGAELVSKSASDAKAAIVLRDLMHANRVDSAESLAAATRAEAEKEAARVERAKAASAPKNDGNVEAKAKTKVAAPKAKK